MNNQLDNNYKNHKIFAKLDKYIKFYDNFSIAIQSFATIGTTAIINLDTYVYSSIAATLESIKTVLADGKINDAFALLRKYYDVTIINTYANLYLSENVNIANYRVNQINNWLHGKLKIPEYRVMSNYIIKSDKLKPITDLLRKENKHKTVRELCNNHLHYNFFSNLLINYNQLYIKTRISNLDAFLSSLQWLFIQHLAYIFYLNDHYMMSNDYIDYLECGQIPPKNSQYWVASFVQDIFDSEIKPYHIDIYTEIKNKTSMHLN